MQQTKKARKGMLSDFLANTRMTRRNFVKTSAATGGALAVSGGLRPTLKAFAQATGNKTAASGEWLPATCQGCTSWCSKQVMSSMAGD